MAYRVHMSTTPWHPGYPFRPRGGKVRRVGSVLLLATLSVGIAGYWYVTDSKRVRAISEHYLNEAIGGRVTVGRARLSFFEGLRLDDVKIRVDNQNAPDSLLATAASLHIQVPLSDALRGDLTGATILAVEPRVLLVSDAKTKQWNVQRLLRPTRTTTRPAGPQQPREIILPQVLLRSARLEFAELVDGKLVRGAPIAVEGNLIPDKQRQSLYTFAVSARSASDQSGTSFTGWTYLPTGEVSARLRNVDLGGSFSAMLPAEVRAWWERHDIEGKIGVPELYIGPTTTGEIPRPFRVVTTFESGAMSVRPEELRFGPSAATRPATAPAEVKETPRLPPIRVDDVRGTLVFTEKGIGLNDMFVRYEGSVLGISGNLGGYSPGSPFTLDLRCDDLKLGESPAFVPSLPGEVREVYDRFLPSGEGRFHFQVARDATGVISTQGRLDILRGKMTFDRFAFPVHDITGSIVVTQVAPGQSRLVVENIRGRGRQDGPNANADLRVEGSMFPLEGGSEVIFKVRGDNVVADDELVAAMPDGVRDVLRLFDEKKTTYPEFGGSFTVDVYRAPGRVSRWAWPIDVFLRHGTGRFAPFPYPLQNVTGEVRIRSGFVDLKDVTTRRDEATLVVNGRVTYGDMPPGKLLYDLDLRGNAIAVDETLIDCIEPERRTWIAVLGIGGMLDLRGKVSGTDARYDLEMQLRDGTLRPKGAKWVATDVTADLNLTPTRLTLKSAEGRRLGHPIVASGTLDWSKGPIVSDLTATAKSLPLDDDLRSMLDPVEQVAWDSVKPEGLADMVIRLAPDQPVMYSIAPLGIAATPSVVPVRVENVRGTIVIGGGRVELNGLTATRGDTRLSLSGLGITRDRGRWDVRLSASDLNIDPELRAALPVMLRETLNGAALEGRANVEVKRFVYVPPLATAASAETRDETGVRAVPRSPEQALLPPNPVPQASSVPPAPVAAAKIARPGEGASVDFEVAVRPVDVTFSLGVPFRATSGAVLLSGTIRDDRLATLGGSVDLTTGQIAGRDFSQLRAGVEKSADRQGLTLSNLTGSFADGELSGYAAVAFPEGESTQYGVNLTLRNVDVSQVVGKLADTSVSGRMSASLTLQGTVDDPRSRRGRGDITVTGEKMARVPVLLGLVQIAYLSLPGDASFNNATARYNMDGPKITFEQLVLRSPGLQIDGAGSIDLDSKLVRLTLWTAPANGPRLPIFSDLADRTRRELLQISVRGTIDNPKVSASSFDSFTTTIEEVFRSSGRSERESPLPSQPSSPRR